MSARRLCVASLRQALGSRRVVPYLFIAPFFLLFAVFGLFPLLFSIVLSLHQWDASAGLEGMRWVGLENFRYAATDPWFLASLGHTLWYGLASGIPQHLIALPLAFVIHRRLRRSRNLVVGAYFLPYITSSVAVSLIFASLLSRDFGLLNALLPGPARDWLGDPDYAMPAIAGVLLWRYLGWNLVLYLSALQLIDESLYEAARIDGASPWQQFRHITLPLLQPMIYFAVTLTLIGSLQLFDEPFILVDQESGILPSVMTTAMFMYRMAFVYGDFGTASAISWLLFLLIAALGWGNHRLLGRKGAGDAF